MSAERAPEGSCYTTARVDAGRPRFAARHVERLRADARRVGLEPPAAHRCREALEALARAAFPGGVGIVRLELRPAPGGVGLVGSARRLGPDPSTLRAAVAPFPHPGPSSAPGAKLTDRRVFDRAAAWARQRGVDEALLVDALGFVVEGARTNLVGMDASGRAFTPPRARGGVAGLALGIVRASLPGLREGDVAQHELAGCRELVALNAVRGARAVVELDGRPVGRGRPGPLWALLDRLLAAAE